MFSKIKPLAAAIGLSFALAAGSATAAINWSSTGDTLFEDDDIDFLIEEDGDGILEPGESLLSVFELNTANAVDVDPQELTGLAVITLLTIIDVDGDGQVDDMVFVPYEDGLNTFLPADQQLADDTGAMAAIFLSDDPDLAISAGNVLGNTVSCDTLEECITQATDGTLWEVDGFNGDPDEYWIALNAEQDTSEVLDGSAAQEFGAFNAGVSILYNGTGVPLALNALDCSPYCTPGGDGFVDVLASGSIKGGDGLSATLIADGAVATSDFDMIKRQAVPEPASLALLAAGLLGLGASMRRRQG